MSPDTSPLLPLLPALMGAVLAIALLQLWLWVGRRADRATLWGSAWCGATLLFLGGHLIQLRAASAAAVLAGGRLAWVGALLIVVAMVGLAHALSGQPALRRALAPLAVASGVLMLLVVLSHWIVTDETYLHSDLLGHYWAPVPGPLMPVVGLYVLAALVFTWQWGLSRPGGLEPGEQRAIRAGFAVYALFGVNDILHAARLIRSVRLFDYGFVIVAFGLTYLLAVRYNRLRAHLEEEVTTRTGELAGALDSARARERELTALGEVGTALVSTLEPSRVLEIIADHALQLIGADGAAVGEVDVQAGVLHLRTARGLGAEELRAFPARLGEGAPGAAVVRREPVWRADVADGRPPSSPEPAGPPPGERPEHPYRGILSVPMLSRDAALGAISVYWREPHTPSEQELRLLRAFAQHAAIAIENASLYEALEARFRRLETLTRLNHLISSSLERDRVLEEINQAAAHLSKARLACLWVADEAARALELVAMSDPSFREGFPAVRPSFDEGLAGWVASHRQRLAIADVAGDARVLAVAWWGKHGLRSFYGVPVVHEGAVIAVVTLLGSEPLRLGAEEEQLLDSLTAHAATAIHNASMYGAAVRARHDAEMALALVKQLQGMLPICAYCKKIRNDRNYWEQIETYISERSEATFSHGVCPECRATVVARDLEAWRQRGR